MARIRFRKPKIAILMSEVISLTVWLFLGDKIIGILDGLVGRSYTMNVTGSVGGTAVTNVDGCTNASVFKDAYEILGIGYDCGDHTIPEGIENVANSSSGLLGVIGLVMVVMVLMNFVSYN